MKHRKNYTIPWAPTQPNAGFVRQIGRTAKFATIQRQLLTFISEQIESWKPDLIIVIERKGTAILRALKEWEECPLAWNWENVISSDAIDQMPDEFFRSRRILIFDDMMRTALHLRHVLFQLSQRQLLEPNNVQLAVFAVHEDCPSQIMFPGGSIDYVWFYHQLISSVYQSIQIQIVNMLQRAGSLMLDTEHIEVRIRLQDDFGRLFSALQRKAEALVFRSSDNRTNITVFYPDDRAHALPSKIFPEGTHVSDIVKKCRIVDRGNDEYAVIPICFPSIPEQCGDWTFSDEDKDLLGTGVNRSAIARFNGVGLIAALEVLRWTIKDLAVLSKEDYTLLLPKNPQDRDSRSGYTLDHLKVVFPTLNLANLGNRIAAIAKEASAEGSRLRARRFDDTQFPPLFNEQLHRDAMRLLQVIRHQLDERVLESELVSTGGSAVEEVPGLTLSEILTIGEGFGWDKPKTSALCDILIDQAALSTDISHVVDDDGTMHVVRTFAPAGEVVSDMVRRYTTQWGLPHGF